ncbi:MAG: hypothetical protein J7K59_07450 [Candidatus Korarchaeota archaeon]|nr:hypothetical protein [Candidatus Korarchaeota archaeon]
MIDWKFWVITGLDYSGKTSVLRILAKKGIPSLHWSDLRKLSFIRPVLERPYDIVFEMGPLSRASFILLITSAMLETMEREKIVLVDSYWYRFYVKEVLFGESEIEVLKKLFDFPKPVRVFYLEVPVEIALKRSNGKFTKYEAFGSSPEDFIRFQKLLDENLRVLLKELNLDVKFMDGTLPLEEIAQKIYNEITTSI